MRTSVLLLLALPLAGWAVEKPPTPGEVFEKRVLPIFRSPKPSSCVQCHLGGVDLKDYILPTSEATFASLRDSGLIDLKSPKSSKILALIRMGEKDNKSGLVHRKTREQELAAFADWVERSARDPRMRALPKASGKKAGPRRPVEVVRHGRVSRVLESFEQNVWAMRFRCMSCHLEGTEQSRKLVAKHGERVAWFKSAGPAATLSHLRQTKLISPETPQQSLLLRKPLLDGVEHGGGKKFEKGDQGYRAFLAFLEDYARVVKDQYPDAKALPPADTGPRRFGTDIWVILSNTPPAWGDKLVAVDVHAWNSRKGAWEAGPVATTDRKVWGKGKMWQHNLVLLAAKGSEREKAWAGRKPFLPAGRYLLKVFLAGEKREYLGQAEVRSSWPEGYGRMTVVEASRVKLRR